MGLIERFDIDLEHGFLIGLLIFAAWIIYQGMSYSETTRLYPLVTATAVILLSLIVLLDKAISDEIKAKIPFVGEIRDDPAGDLTDEDPETGDVDETAVVYLALYFGAYLLSVIYLGFIISSMALMYAVQHYFDYKDWKVRIALTVLMGLLVVIGSIVVNIPLTHGEIFSG